jgi:formylglycine-generating enzyme required for sulfatase activity
MRCDSTSLRFFVGCVVGLMLAAFSYADRAWSQSRGRDTRIALLVGNASYPDAGTPLRQLRNSLHALADVLRRNAFQVDTKENLGKQELLRAMEEFKGRIVPGSTALFFFSGYGLQKDRETFIIPINAQIWGEGDIERDGVSMESVLSGLTGARAKLVILDASRPNPYEPRFRRSSAGLAPITAPVGSLVLSATAPGKIVDESSDGSIFINELVKEMQSSALTMEEIVSRTRRNIARITKGQQVLWMSSSLVDDILFRDGSPRPAKTASDEAQWPVPRKEERPASPQPTLRKQPQPGLNERKTEAWALSIDDTGGKTAKPGDVLRDCADCPELVVIPRGRFEMGSNEFSFEKPVHWVRIARPFAIGRWEISVDQWEKCVAAGKCMQRAASGDRGSRATAVTNISWSDAKAYVAWLSQETGRKYRLPTEAEWEYAARAGSRTPYWWGRSLDARFARCRECGRGGEKAAPPGNYFANPFGLFDTAGNAAEWVEDCWNDNYRKAPQDGSAWTSGECRQRVLRGGAFDSPARYLRSASRFRYDVDVRYFANGFRVVRDLP